MKDSLESENNKKINEEKQIEINKIITIFKLNKESLLIDQYNDFELFNKIREIAISKGGFLNFNNRKILWDYLFYRRKNKKGIIDLIKINKNIGLSLSKLNLIFQTKELTPEKLNKINEYHIILNDLPRTCKNILLNNTSILSNSDNVTKSFSKKNNISNINNSNNLSFSNNKNISTEIFMFTCDKMRYKYLQGLLNIIFYFRKIFNFENSINTLNIYFEYFMKDFVDEELSEVNNDENIGLISSIVSELYNYLYLNGKSNAMEDYIPILSNKWIISNFLSEITNIDKGFRILDYLIVSEPYAKYVLATVLINKFNIYIMNQLRESLDSSFENIFDKLKKDDINFVDFDEAIDEVEKINDIEGQNIKDLLFKKYGEKFVYSFNKNNFGLISYYKDLVELFQIKKPKKRIRLNIKNLKLYKYFIYILVVSLIIYFIYKYIDENRYFW